MERQERSSTDVNGATTSLTSNTSSTSSSSSVESSSAYPMYERQTSARAVSQTIPTEPPPPSAGRILNSNISSLPPNNVVASAAASNFLVSEQEEDYDDFASRRKKAGALSEGATSRPPRGSDVISSLIKPDRCEGEDRSPDGPVGGDGENSPAEIPPEDDVEEEEEEEEEDNVEEEEEEEEKVGDEGNAEEDADESDYEYDYEDEGDTHFSGFLVSDPHPSLVTTAASSSASVNQPQEFSGSGRIVEEEEDNSPRKTSSTSSTTSKSSSSNAPKWREPSQEAVSMSLRAEREKTGGKRRLASDLYKVMMKDTEEAGFTIEPKSEESMDKWKIKLFAFDEDSNLYKDLVVLGFDHVELEMSFPDQYPFEPPFVRVVRPRFKRQTGFVMNGALCMELLTSEGWNPVNDIESVIVSIRSLLAVGDGRLQAALDMPEKKREAILAAAKEEKMLCAENGEASVSRKRPRAEDFDDDGNPSAKKSASKKSSVSKAAAGQYTVAEAKAAYTHLSDYHKKKGWDSSGWWSRKG